MSQLVTIDLDVSVVSPDGIETAVSPEPVRFVPGSLLPKTERVTLTASVFTALSPPTGAKAVVIFVGSATSLTLKGVTGDGTGIVVAPTSAPIGLPVMLPLGATPSIGILNGVASDQIVTVRWL